MPDWRISWPDRRRECGMPTIRYACLTNPGRTHRCNDDRWYADSSTGLYLVADGMGVEAPARLVVDLLPDSIRRRLPENASLADESCETAIRDAIREVSERIHAAALSEQGGNWLGLGATIILAMVRWP